jgi:hypothetical protein
MERRASKELDELGARLAAWREAHGGRGSRIPEELWKDAVRVAQVEGVSETAKALRLSNEGLNRRARQHLEGKGGSSVTELRKGAGQADRKPAEIRVKRTADSSSGSAGAEFVALEMAQLGGAGRTVVELLDRHGDRMRVEVAGSVDVAGLVQTFWRRSS